MSAPVEYSQAAWTVANKFSRVLGSETRDLAGWVELALKATRQDEREECAAVADKFGDPEIRDAILERKDK